MTTNISTKSRAEIAALPSPGPQILDAPTFNGQTRELGERQVELGPGTLFSRFQIVSRIGAGGMGEVYKVWDPSLKRHVAIKILLREKIATEEMLRRFAREACAASALNHPNIITVYEIGHADLDNAVVDFMAMELIEGETLRSFLSRSLEMPKALHYLAQIADGLAKAHAAGILHRDLKPENIMITSDGFAKILDFGLARTAVPDNGGSDAEGETRSATITLPGTVAGTIGYMSPEQVRGSAIDQRSDIFSFGCILYEVLTRRRPFQGNSAVDTFHKIVYEPPKPIGEVDPPVSDALRRVTLKCLGKNPEERYQSAKEIAIDLREIRREYESGDHSSNVISGPRSTRGTRPRAFWLWIAGLVLILTTTAVIWSRLAPGRKSPERGGLESMTIERLPSTSNVLSAAISIDGRYIAHVESSARGEVLFVRQVATGSEIEAAPADGKSYGELSFSPDGEYVRYVHDGALRQSPALGGAGKILIDNFSYPVSFSPDGKRCVFVRAGSLFLAQSDGSGERRIGSATKGEEYVRPVWSPQGDAIACTRRSQRMVETGNMWIELLKPQTVDSGPAVSVSAILGERWYQITSMSWLPDASGIALSATRRALVEKQLYEISYPEGRTRRLTNDLFEYEGAGITGDGRVLVSEQTDKRSSVWLIPRDRPELARKIVEGVGSIRNLAASPDGDIIYSASSAGGGSDIWRMALDGTRRKQLTDDPASDGMPAVSPDGRTIAFMSSRTGQLTIWTMDADGAHQTQITTEGRDVRPWFSPDGKWLVYNSRGPGGSFLYRITARGGKPSPIRTSWTLVPAISPDGRFIAAVDKDRKLGVISATDGSPIRSFNEQSINEIRWTKDSRAIAFVRNKAPVDGLSSSAGPSIYLQHLDGRPAEKIVDVSPDEIVAFDWTPDGKSILVARVANQKSVVMLKNFR